MLKLTALIGAIFLLGLSSPIFAQALTLEQQRATFEEARAALNKGQRTHFRKLKKQLGDYALVPYLEYWELKRYLYATNDAQIVEYTQKYPFTALSEIIQRRWLLKLGQQKKWKAYLKAYARHTERDRTDLECHYLTALWKTGQNFNTHKAQALWLYPKSQPKACDALFNELEQRKAITQGMVWKRLISAYDKNSVTLARYLMKKLPKNQQKAAKLWRKVHLNPAQYLRPKYIAKNTHELDALVVNGFERMSRKQLDRAIEKWQAYQNEWPLKADTRHQIQRTLALRSAVQFDAKAEQWLKSLNYQDEETLEALKKLQLRSQQWGSLLNTLNQLKSVREENPSDFYWRARAMEKIGLKDQAENIYHILADKRGYYSFLSADRLKKPYKLNHNPLEIKQKSMDFPWIERANELKAVGLDWLARLEWRYGLNHLSDSQKRTLASIAKDNGWTEISYYTIQQSNHWDDLEMRYPLPFKQHIGQKAKQYNIESSWIYGVIRQESAFVADARSGAGALGLMQLKPSTARYIAGKYAMSKPNKSDLIDPATNITLGSRYLKYVLEKFSNNAVLATAAYNAGPGNVSKWAPKTSLEADIWIDTIPFSETRHYVKAVLTNSIIFEWRLNGRVGNLSKKLQRVPANYQPK